MEEKTQYIYQNNASNLSDQEGQNNTAQSKKARISGQDSARNFLKKHGKDLGQGITKDNLLACASANITNRILPKWLSNNATKKLYLESFISYLCNSKKYPHLKEILNSEDVEQFMDLVEDKLTQAQQNLQAGSKAEHAGQDAARKYLKKYGNGLGQGITKDNLLAHISANIMNKALSKWVSNDATKKLYLESFISYLCNSKKYPHLKEILNSEDAEQLMVLVNKKLNLNNIEAKKIHTTVGVGQVGKENRGTKRLRREISAVIKQEGEKFAHFQEASISPASSYYNTRLPKRTKPNEQPIAFTQSQTQFVEAKSANNGSASGSGKWYLDPYYRWEPHLELSSRNDGSSSKLYNPEKISLDEAPIFHGVSFPQSETETQRTRRPSPNNNQIPSPMRQHSFFSPPSLIKSETSKCLQSENPATSWAQPDLPDLPELSYHRILPYSALNFQSSQLSWGPLSPLAQWDQPSFLDPQAPFNDVFPQKSAVYDRLCQPQVEMQRQYPVANSQLSFWRPSTPSISSRRVLKETFDEMGVQEPVNNFGFNSSNHK